jgi:hypothetical protein
MLSGDQSDGSWQIMWISDDSQLLGPWSNLASTDLALSSVKSSLASFMAQDIFEVLLPRPILSSLKKKRDIHTFTSSSGYARVELYFWVCPRSTR